MQTASNRSKMAGLTLCGGGVGGGGVGEGGYTVREETRNRKRSLGAVRLVTIIGFYFYTNVFSKNLMTKKFYSPIFR